MTSARRFASPLRDAWIQLLSEYERFDAFVTIGFSMYLDVHRATACLNHLVVRLNRSLHSKRYLKHEQWLSGVAVLERKRGSHLAPNGPHFHLLLRGPGPGSLDLERLSQLLDKHAGRLRYPTGNPLRPFGRPVSGSAYVDVQSIFEIGRLASYLTKELRYQSTSSVGTSIGFIGPNGVDGIFDV